MPSEHHNYYLPSADKRQENARRIRIVHEASCRAILLREVEEPTLPDHDTSEIPRRGPGAGHQAKQSYSRGAKGALERLRDTLAPTAELTSTKGEDQDSAYFRLTEYDAAGNPIWAIADHNQSGNAIYIWRRDLSGTDPDTALATTRRKALGHGCLRRYHPASMDTLAQEDIDSFYQDKVLETLTA